MSTVANLVTSIYKVYYFRFIILTRSAVNFFNSQLFQSKVYFSWLFCEKKKERYMSFRFRFFCESFFLPLFLFRIFFEKNIYKHKYKMYCHVIRNKIFNIYAWYNKTRLKVNSVLDREPKSYRDLLSCSLPKKSCHKSYELLDKK